MSDIEASVAFYRRFGYTAVRPINEQTLSRAETTAWGFTETVRYRGADVTINRGDRHRLRLLQWLEPFDPEPAYPPRLTTRALTGGR